MLNHGQGEPEAPENKYPHKYTSTHEGETVGGEIPLAASCPQDCIPLVPSDHQLDDTIFWLLSLPSFTSLPLACIWEDLERLFSRGPPCVN